MKFVISFFLCASSYASPIHLFHEGAVDQAHVYKEILVKEYLIPEDLIIIKPVAICEKLNVEGKLDLCLKNNGDLYVVSVDREFINESLKVFRAP